MNRGTRNALAAGLIAIMAAGLLVSFRVSVQTSDSLWYASKAATGEKMFHPHHLLFVPAVWLLHRYFLRPVFSYDVIASGQVHNIIWAAAAVAAVFVLSRRLFPSPPIAWIVSFGLLFSQGFWLYATQFEVYVPALSALACLLVALTASPPSRLSLPSLLAIATFLALAICYHQTNALFCIPLCYYLVASRGKAGGRAAATVVLSVGLLILSGYLAVFLYSGRPATPAGFLRYCLVYAYAPDPDWGSWANVSPEGLRRLIQSQLWNLAEFPSLSAPRAAAFGGILLALVTVWNFAIALCRPPDRPLRVSLLLWVLVYYAFFLWWLPVEKEFFIIPLLPLLLLGGLFLSDVLSLAPRYPWFRRAVLLSAAVAVGILAEYNFTRSFLPQHRQPDLDADRARRLDALIPGDCAIGTDITGSTCLLYFCKRDLTLNMRDPLLAFYQSKPLPPRVSAYRDRCLFVPVEYVDPGYRVIRTDYDGYRFPDRWLAYFRWLLACESDQTGRVIGCRAFQAVTVGRDEVYLRLGAERRPVDGMKGLFRELGAEIDRREGSGGGRFQKWLAAVSSPAAAVFDPWNH
jgi:hypothetical protein